MLNPKSRQYSLQTLQVPQAAAQFGRAVIVTPHDATAHLIFGNALLAQDTL
jgi:hypothetical protein